MSLQFPIKSLVFKVLVNGPQEVLRHLVHGAGYLSACGGAVALPVGPGPGGAPLFLITRRGEINSPSAPRQKARPASGGSLAAAATLRRRYSSSKY